MPACTVDRSRRYARGVDGNSRAWIPAPTNLRVCLELQRNNPDPTKIASLTNLYFMAVATQGVMQVATIVIMARLATGI
jgi:hypothetical protein